MPNFRLIDEPQIGVQKTSSQTGTFTDVAIWTPASGRKVRLSGGIISGTGLSDATLQFGTGGGAVTIAVFRLGAQDTVPFTFPLPLEGAVGQVVSWTGGVTLLTMSIALIGQEI